MNSYSLTLVLKNDLAEKERTELLGTVTKSFGKLIKEDLWGSRSLVYQIKHQDKGFYTHYEFESEPDQISRLDKMVKLNEDVLRYLLIRN